MEYQNEGIRHISIQSKKQVIEDDSTESENSDSNDESESEDNQLETSEINLGTILTAVSDIDESSKNNNNDNRESYIADCNKNYRSRPKTAVLKYTKPANLFYDDVESDSKSVSFSEEALKTSKQLQRRGKLNASLPIEPPPSRLSVSFSNSKVKDIDAENQRLLKAILRKRSTSYNIEKPKQKPMRVQSAAAINRSRQQQEIDRENLRLLHKIQTAKSTSGLTREKLVNDHITNEKHAQRISKSHRRPVSAPARRTLSALGSSRASSSFDTSSVVSSNSSLRSSASKRSTSARPQRVLVQQYWEPGW